MIRHIDPLLLAFFRRETSFPETFPARRKLPGWDVPSWGDGENEPFRKPPSKRPFLKILAGIAALVLLALVLKPFVERDESGGYRLAPWRQKKLEKKLKDLQEAEQYVLKAAQTGWYPCHSCTDTIFIFLRKGEVWKYGFTTKGEKGRYRNKLKGLRLEYEIQFEGGIEACLLEEQRKIFAYALLPENQSRKIPLIRPPGNKKDW